MRFKTERQKGEWPMLDPRVRAIFLELEEMFGHLIPGGFMITHIRRTPEEQQLFYPTEPNRTSPHLDDPVRAIDIRNSDISPELRVTMANYFNEWWPEAVILWNDRGTGSPHLHIAVRKRNA